MATVASAHSLFKYDPSVAAAIIFLVLFFGSTIWHLYQIIRSKTMYLCPIVICGLCEVVGFACRLASRQDPSNRNLYSAHYAFLVLAPIFLAASVYIMLGRIIRFVNYPSLISAKRIAIVFVTCDIISFLVQIIGAVILLSKNTTTGQDRGRDFLLAGLIIQIITFSFFTICAVHFDLSVAKTGQHGGKWRWLIKALYAACALILIRTIFRVIEFSQGSTGYLQTTEWPFYVFDAVLVFLAMILFNIIHPGEYLATNATDFAMNPSATNQPQTNDMPVMVTSNTKPIEFA